MRMKYFFTPLILLSCSQIFAQDHFPDGFSKEVAYDQFDGPGGYLPTDSTIAAVWEIQGKLFIIKDEIVPDSPVIDITEEVAFWGDLGLVGAALDPHFLQNGYVYLLYNVDRHYYKYFGTAQYDPNATETYGPTMGRLTRYTVNTNDFESLVPNSRHILLGDSVGNGIAVCTASHGVGIIKFGEDGSLLLTAGDGNTWVGTAAGTGYNGTGPIPDFGYDSLAYADGLITSKEFLGAYRAQYLDGLNGKLLRINPETGEGMPNNPFYRNDAPNSPRSKIWALGMRNPYRMTIKPETGYGDLSDGFPGIVYVSDVGDWVWEEINVVREGGLNFGWPMFQGPVVHPFYNDAPTQNTNAPNPLAGNIGCEKPYFNYQNTVVQANQFHDYNYPNPCNPAVSIPDSIQTFIHEQPALAYGNAANVDNPYAIIPAWDSQGNATYMKVTDPNSPVEGINFSGYSGSGGAFLEGEHIPHEYQGWYVQADYSGWLNAFYFDSNNDLQRIENWSENLGGPVHVIQSPNDGCIYVTSIFPPKIYRICYGGNQKPFIVVTPDLVYGNSPQNVHFDASASYDPEGGSLDFYWDFGDGSTGTGGIIDHSYTAPDNNVATYTATLTVTDSAAAFRSIAIPVSLNNTPPQVNITGITEGQLYAIDSATSMWLSAEVDDAEQSADEMNYHWQLYLHHNQHYHNLEAWEGNNIDMQVVPTGCSEHESYWYEIKVTVTDPGGLTDSDSRNIYPNCDGTPSPGIKIDQPFLILPNPAENYIDLYSQVSLGSEVQYYIYGSDGKIDSHNMVGYLDDKQNFRINISALSSGVYVLKFNVKGEWYQERFVKINY